MFSPDIVNRAVQYTDALLGNNVALSPADNEFGKVIEAIAFPMMNTRGIGLTNGDLETINKFLASESAHDENGGIDQLSQAIAESIGRNIKLAREVALPLINATTIAVEHQIESIEGELRKSLSYDISENPVYELIVNSATINEIIKTAGNSTFDGYGGGVKILPPMSLESIMELCRTGSSEFDELLADVFNHIGENNVKMVYNETLCNRGNKFQNTLKDEELLASYLMGYAIMSNIGKDNIPEDVNLSLEEFTKRCLEYKAYCRYHLKVFVSGYRHKENGGNVVHDITYNDDYGVKMNIIPSMYKQAVEQGITNEAIIGSTFATNGSWNITSLLREKDKYIQLFEAKQQEVLTQVKNKKVEIIINAMRVAINNIGKDSEIQFNRLDWDKIRNVIENRIRTDSQVSPSDLMIDFVMSDLFSGTMVPMMIRRMNNYSKKMSEAKPEVLAYKAVMDITIQHLMGRVKLVATKV